MDIMIDIETVGTGPDACILTIAAQTFDPNALGYLPQDYYARVDIDSQPNREVDDATVEWWATQPQEAQDEAFGEEGRISLKQALEELSKLCFHCNLTWANGTTFDMVILENAYKQEQLPLPWRFWNVRDARTVYSLYPDLPKPKASHHALEDCKRQIDLLQQTLQHLGVTKLR
jgi:hypothetical protein|tara:strand:- start:119 stop:640 length:522 start_codon:yes stop_codon:yes gene_type:complete